MELKYVKNIAPINWPAMARTGYVNTLKHKAIQVEILLKTLGLCTKTPTMPSVMKKNQYLSSLPYSHLPYLCQSEEFGERHVLDEQLREGLQRRRQQQDVTVPEKDRVPYPTGIEE